MIVSVKWLSFGIKVEGKFIYMSPYEEECANKADLTLVSCSHFNYWNVSKIEKGRKTTCSLSPRRLCLRNWQETTILKV